MNKMENLLTTVSEECAEAGCVKKPSIWIV